MTPKSGSAFQISQMKATLAPVLMEVLLKNQPEGLQLAINKVNTALCSSALCCSNIKYLTACKKKNLNVKKV